MSKPLIIDVCGTLVREDTTIGLLRWHLRRTSRWRYLILMAVTARRSPLRLAAMVAERVTGKHITKHMLVRLLKGELVEDLEHSGQDYAHWLLANSRSPLVTQLIEQDRPNVPRILASASLEPVVRALAQQLSADYVASSLECRDGRLTGRYATDLSGRKIPALDEKFGDSWRRGGYCAISDNLSDRSLLEAAERAYVVLHRSRHRARWQALDAVFVGLDA